MTRANPIALFDYQEEDRRKVVDGFLDREVTRQLIVWPTGSGKTVLFSSVHNERRMVEWTDSFSGWHRKILVIAHRDELIQQAVDKIERSNPTLQVGVEKANQYHAIDDDVVVASVQTLSACRGKRLKKMNPKEYRIVVIDEAHHATSPSYYAVLQHFGFLPPAEYMAESRPRPEEGRDAKLEWQRDRLASWDSEKQTDQLLLGVTATPKRGDNIGLEAVFQEITVNRTIREMIERGRLSKIRAFRVQTTTSLDDVSTRAGDLAQDELAQAVNVSTRNATAVKAYVDYAPGRKGIAFTVDVAHAQNLAAAFRAVGIKAEAVYGAMPPADRASVLDRYRRGELRILTNCNLLTEGFDEPDVQVIIHARPTKSSLLYIQMSGRGLRVAAGKENCIIIDLVDVTRRHSLFTSPELLGLPADFDAKGDDLMDLNQQFEAVQAKNPLADLSDIKSLDDIKLKVAEVDLLSTFHDENIDNHSHLAWHRTGEGYQIQWRGELVNERMQIVERGENQWQAAYHKGKITQWSGDATNARDAFGKAEEYLRAKLAPLYLVYRRDASWRSLPATDLQKQTIARFGVAVNTANLTKGDANNLISKLYAQKNWK